MPSKRKTKKIQEFVISTAVAIIRQKQITKWKLLYRLSTLVDIEFRVDRIINFPIVRNVIEKEIAHGFIKYVPRQPLSIYGD